MTPYNNFLLECSLWPASLPASLLEPTSSEPVVGDFMHFFWQHLDKKMPILIPGQFVISFCKTFRKDYKRFCPLIQISRVYRVFSIQYMYRTLAIINRDYYYFYVFVDVWQYSFETRWLQNKSGYN